MSGHGLESWSKYRFSVPAIVDVPLGQVLASGFYGTAPTVLAVDADGRLIALIYGKDGVTQRQVAVDASGQIIMVPRGQSGNYLDVDASGFLTSVMKGVDGVTLRTVAVDASGKILGVLQGDYAGALKTLAVDDKGRMLAVLTDPEDVFGNPHYMGSAELAVRLGSPMSFDRRGDLMFVDDFSCGLSRISPWTSGSGYGVNVDVTHVQNGPLACKLTSGSSASHYAGVDHFNQYSVLSKMGLAMSMTFGFYTESITLRFQVFDGTNYHLGQVRWQKDNDTIYYLDEDGNEQVLVSDYGPRVDDYTFHPWKLVIDPVNGMYLRVMVEDREIDMSTLPLRVVPSTISPYVFARILNTGNVGANSACWLDHYIITQNEL